MKCSIKRRKIYVHTFKKQNSKKKKNFLSITIHNKLSNYFHSFFYCYRTSKNTHYYTGMTPFDALVLKDKFCKMFQFEEDVVYSPQQGPVDNPISMMDGYLQFSDQSVSNTAINSNPNMNNQSTSRCLLPSFSNCFNTNDLWEPIDLNDIQPDVIFPDSSSSVSEYSSSNVSTTTSIGDALHQGPLQHQANTMRNFVPINISNQTVTTNPYLNLSTQARNITDIDLTMDTVPGKTIQEYTNNHATIIQPPKFHVVTVGNHTHLSDSYQRLPPAMQSLGINHLASNFSIVNPQTYKTSTITMSNHITTTSATPSVSKLKTKASKGRKQYLKENLIKSNKNPELDSLLIKDNQVDHIPKATWKFKTRFQSLKDILEATIQSEKRYFKLGYANGPLAPGIKKKLTELGTEANRLARTTAVKSDAYTKFPTYFEGKQV